MKFIYYIIHTFTGCPNKDLTWHKNIRATCQKCGRVTFYFKKY